LGNTGEIRMQAAADNRMVFNKATVSWGQSPIANQFAIVMKEVAAQLAQAKSGTVVIQ
jgi:hypothetical protein